MLDPTFVKVVCWYDNEFRPFVNAFFSLVCA